MKEVDAIIIGTGQGGMPLAISLAGDGKEVVIFERSRVGGSCINYGCTPSKTFLAAAHAAGRARAAGSLGVKATLDIDFPLIMRRVRETRDSWSEGSKNRIVGSGAKMIMAEGSFTPQGSVEGGGEEYSAPLVVINTGTSPFIPPVPGLEDVHYLTDRVFWEITQLPATTLILGGGYVGLELGQGLARLGSEVHIIDMQDRVMSTESPDVSEVISEALRRDGVIFHLGVRATGVQYSGGTFGLELEGGEILEGDALYVATGREPNTKALNAEAAGIELDGKEFTSVNDKMETSRDGVYAIGDVTGQPAFTHIAWEDHRRLLSILSGGDRRRGDRVLGYAMYTEPQLGRAGLSLEEALSEGYDASEARMNVSDMSRGIEWGQDLGFYQLVVDNRSGRIIGATLVGYEAGELVHVLLDLIEAGATWELLQRAQYIHPTYAENLPSIARMFGTWK
jgi:pyruvate/2-oxoglutarate dehydrogenase complex dihydrolipoamide dehydrogenase (E3) component